MATNPITPAKGKDELEKDESKITSSKQKTVSTPSSVITSLSMAPTPPPEAFQSFPLSSGTIHPPSFFTKKSDSSFTSTSSSSSQHSKNKNDVDSKEVVVEQEQEDVEQFPIKVKGIDEFLNESNTNTTNDNDNSIDIIGKNIDTTRNKKESKPKSNEESSRSPSSSSSIKISSITSTSIQEEKKTDNKESKDTVHNVENNISSSPDLKVVKKEETVPSKEDTRVSDTSSSDPMTIESSNKIEIESVTDSSYEGGKINAVASTTTTPVTSRIVANTDQNNISLSNNNITLKEGEGGEELIPTTTNINDNNTPTTKNATTKNATTIHPKSTLLQPRRSDENDHVSIASSISNSNSRSLLPRSLGSSIDLNSPPSKKLVNMALHLRTRGGSRSPSVLSSQEDLSKDSSGRRIETGINRMKNIGLLLDRHHQQMNRERKNIDDEDSWWQNDNNDKSFLSSTEDRSSIESSEESTRKLTAKKGQFSIRSSEGSDNSDYPISTKIGTKSLQTHVRKHQSTETSSVASSVENTKKKFGRRLSLASVPNNEQGRDSLFDNFDKTWQSFHFTTEGTNDQQDSSNAFVREQLCFASMVLVLLQRVPNEATELSTSWKKSVPLDVVKLFWKEVILTKNGDDSKCRDINIPSDCDIDKLAEKIADVLLNKLCYISIEVDPIVDQKNETPDRSTSFRVKLSHKVYADYSRHILKTYTKHHPQEQINQWNEKFVSVLENLLLSNEDDEGAKEKVSQQVLNYAALNIPKLILISCHTAESGNGDSKLVKATESEREYQNNRIGYLVALMKNSSFLSQRMNILGATSNCDSLEQKDNENDEKKRFPANSYIANIKFNVLEATKAHLEDLESINTVIATMSKEISIETDDGVMDTTEAILLMYKAWKDRCLSMIQISNDNDTVKPQVEPVSSTPSKSQSHNRNLRFIKENRLEPVIKASEATQRTLPNHFQLSAGEYNLKVNGHVASLEKMPVMMLKNSDLSKKQALKRPKHQESRRTPGATMKLPDALEIDPVLLYHYLSVGKSISLLGKSIFEATLYATDSSSAAKGVKSLVGATPNAASIGYSIASIEIYMQLTHLMSFILSKDLADIDEDDLIDVGYYYDKNVGSLDPSSRMKKLLQDRIEATTLMEKLNILCAESWLAMGNYLMIGIGQGHNNTIEMSAVALLNHLNEDTVSDVDPSITEGNDEEHEFENGLTDDDYRSSLQFKVLLCFQMALGVLLHNSSFDKSFESELTSIVVHERNLQASITHSIGVYHYEQVGDYERAKSCVDASLASRRLLLRLLQREDPDDLGSMSGSSMGSRSMKRSYKRSYHGSSHRMSNKHKNKSKKEVSHPSETSYQTDAILSLEPTRKKQVVMIEKGLSATLEFSALASHCMLDYETSLSLFQEALILRALHSGKDSLEVASLQYNMGVVHDDLAQYESSLGRYGESLRVRFGLLQKLKEEFTTDTSSTSVALELVELEASVILTLKCMGNVYRTLNDETNSIGCLMKAIELLKDKLRRRTTESSIGPYQSGDGDLGFGKGMAGQFPSFPMPNVILDEIKSGGKNSSFHMKGVDKHPDSASNELSQDDMTRKDIANIYTTMISLVHERKAHLNNGKNSRKSGYMSSGSYGSASSPARAYKSINKHGKKKGLDANSDNDSITLDSAFNLGLLALHFKNHKNALSFFEEALRTLWTSSCGESSSESSDSDRSSSKRRPKKIYLDGQVEEGALYHALAIAHASLSDHERAIRCYVTALRYYRRRLGLESLTVAGALYDCAYSYWRIDEFSRAEDFWADCLKMLLSCDGITDNTESALSPLCDLHVARTLYNLAASKICKGEYGDQYIDTCLNDASSILQRLSNRRSGQTFNVEIGHCFFYSGFVHYKKSLSMVAAKNRKSLDTPKNSSSQVNIEDLKCREGHLYHALSCVDDSLNSYLRDNGAVDIGLEQVKIGQKLQHPMQAHIAHLSGWIHDALGSVTQAQWNYKTAVRLLNKVYSPQNLFSGSAMYSLGKLYVRIGNTKEALIYFEDSLLSRAKILGSEHSTVADTLFQMAEIIGNIPDYMKATAMYSHCLKVRILTEGNDGANVATTLLNLALLHDKFGYHRKSQECLVGALRVRRSRLQSIIHGCITNVEQSIEGENNGSEDELQNTTREEQTELAVVLHYLGNVLLKIGDATEAMKFYNEALSLRRTLCGVGDGGFAEFVGQGDVDHAIEVKRNLLRDMADTLHNIGGIYETQNMQQKALSCYNQALIIKRSTSREKKVEFSLDDQIKSCNTLSSAITLLRIGTIHNELHNYDVGLSYYKSALDIQRQHLGRDHILVAQTLAEMGETLRRRMDSPIEFDFEEKAGLEFSATKCFNEALRISKLCYGPDHISVAGVMFNIGSIHDLKGDYNQALDCYQHSVKVYGREYARTLCKSLFDLSSIQSKNRDEIVDIDHGLFHPTSFRNNHLPIEKRTSVLFSRGVARSPSVTSEIDREAYTRASIALAQVASRSGLIWLNSSAFESFILRILHFISTNGVDPIKGTLRRTLENFALASSHATVTRVTDTPQSNYLYLIQE